MRRDAVVARACAAVTALWLVLCGVLGLRHQAQVAHVLDERTGGLVHAPRLDGHHDAASGRADLHGRQDTGDEDGPCVLAATHAAHTPSASPIAALALVEHPAVPAAPAAPLVAPADAVFRLAPKTSPPRV